MKTKHAGIGKCGISKCECKGKALIWTSKNLYKVGTADYYRDQIDNIAMVLDCYDGYDPKNAKSMRELLGEIKKMADQALKHKKLYVGE